MSHVSIDADGPESPAARAARLVTTFAELLNTRRFAELDTIIATDLIVHDPRAPQGRDAMLSAQRAQLDALPDARIEVLDIVVSADGDRVATRTRTCATHVGDYMGVPATGEQLAWDSYDFWRVRDGRLAELWGLADRASLLAQLGASPDAPPAPTPSSTSPETSR
jgi:steroid delta-isomerase-like uncharacterized protein